MDTVSSSDRTLRGIARGVLMGAFSRLLTLFVALAALLPASSFGDSPATPSKLSLISVAPAGEDVPPPNQIVFTFDQQVVPLGRMERAPNEIGISITPPLACQWRWINTSALACALNDRELPKVATRYTIVVPKTFDTTKGEALSAEVTSTFTTNRPQITESWFKGWNGPGEPVIGLALNQRVSEESVRSHLRLVDERGATYDLTVTQMPIGPDEIEDQQNGLIGPPRWLLSPVKPLPLDTAVSLKVTPGIVSQEGSELGAEDRVVLSFSTFPQFAFLGISCTTVEGKLIEAIGGAKPQGACDPLNGVRLLFSAPVMKDQVARALRAQPDLRGGRTDFDPWDDVYSESQLTYAHRKDSRYSVSLPYGLRANATYNLSAESGTLHDEFGRKLTQSIFATFSTSHRAPRYHLENTISVLEKETDSKLPLIVNNLTNVKVNYQAVTTSSNASGLSKVLKPYNAQDIAYPFPIDVRDLLQGRSGLVQGNLSTTPRTREGGQWFFSQVTPYEVHAKLGHFSSLVWVTSFATGAPITDAKVSIVVDTMTNLSKNRETLASAQTDGRGLAQLPGARTFDPSLTRMYEWEYKKPRIVVTVEKDGDLAYLPVSWDFQVYAGEVYPSTRKVYGHVHSWGTTAQGVYKAGDAVQFAFWVRDQNDSTFVSAPRSGYKLEVLDPTGKSVFQAANITLSEFGGYAGEFTTKRDAAVGWYTFNLTAPFLPETLSPLRVLVSDFTPASFKVGSELKGVAFHAEDSVTVTTEARLHAGGPYTDAATRVTAVVRGAPLSAQDPRYEGFQFDSDVGKDSQVFQEERPLDSRGDLITNFTLPKVEIPYGSLVVESAVRDDRGKHVVNVATAKFIGRDRFVGITHGGWILNAGNETTFQGLVVNEQGHPLPNAPFSMKVEYEDTKAVRVKSAGNVYVTKYENTWTEVTSCNLTSAATPVSCAFTPTRPGEYRLTATVVDSKGREHRSELTRWASGRGDVVWNSGQNTELQIVPEKKSYKVGEVAKFLIQNPYPGAQALFTTERYGIQSSWTKTLTENVEVIELPITKDHIPGVFLSATIVSPRVEKPIENKVDLGKPAFRMGYAKVVVVDPAKQVSVSVKPRKESYKPRETVTVDVAGLAAGDSPQQLEYAVTVLDEGVFDLIQGKDSYFDPYRGFYTLDDLDVRNFNLIRLLVGRQNFEKKGANAGGDGGSSLDMRTIKRYVSYWNPSVTPDGAGNATFSFEAPDNLTGWKVLVMAVTKEDQMGLGSASFKVNKDTEVRAALPNQVREGDTFTATFTVMNRSDRVRDLTVEAKVEGDAAIGAPQTLTIHAEPFKRYSVQMESTARTVGEARFVVTARNGVDGDSVLGTVRILPRVALQTAATFGSSDGSPVREEISFPTDLNPTAGALEVVLTSSILGGLEGAFSYMQEYPYGCWEQKISKAVMAAHYLALRKNLPATLTWADADSIVKDVLGEISSFQAPSGGIGFYGSDEGAVSPYLSAYTALALVWLRDLGYSIPESEEKRLVSYLSELLRKESFPTFFSPGMRSSVRAVALAALGARKKVTVEDLNRYRGALREMNLFGKAMYLSAAAGVAHGEAFANEAERQIRSFGTQSAGTLRFSEPVEAVSSRILDSNMRTHCAILDGLMREAATGSKETRERVTPLIQPLVRSITVERKRKDRWENTQENTFCVHALAQYAAHFEGHQPNLAISVRLNDEELGKVTMKAPSSEPIELSRPLMASDAGRTEALTITPDGKGRFYHTSRLSYSPKTLKTTPSNAGMEMVRQYSVKRNGQWLLLSEPLAITQGELVKVDLYLSLATARSFVVVSDPIPGGLEPVNRDLATTSVVDGREGAFEGPQNAAWFDGREWIDFGVNQWSFYHKELRHNAARFYSEYLPAGHYHLSYVSQAIAAGEFITLPTHAEEMYDPDVFGDSAPTTLKVSSTELK